MNAMLEGRKNLLLLLTCAVFLVLWYYVWSSRNIESDSTLGNVLKNRGPNIPATTGVLFNGEVCREFKGQRLFQDESEPLPWTPQKGARTSGTCENWSVVTTIMEPSPAVAKQARLGPNWCLVIVLDKKSLANYKIDGLDEEEQKRVTYLDIDAQEEFRSRWNITMMSKLPWNHFGRKNVGYLFAITHGAKRIWDFDDDNLLISENFQVPEMTDKLISFKEAPMHNFSTFNCYPVMGATQKPIWPRGLPLNHVKNQDSYFIDESDLQEATVPTSSVSVIQSLANQDPDLDAIYRLILPLPVQFQSNIGSIAVPKDSYAPLNAQAALFLESALPMLFLPTSVHGRVSDIWRGYILQRICKELDTKILMTSPLVRQDRNLHNIIADLQSEQDLYLKSEALINVLDKINFKSTTMTHLLEEIYIEMYKRCFVEEEDIYLVQDWILALQNIGYIYRYSNTRVSVHKPDANTREVNAISSKIFQNCSAWPDLKLFVTMNKDHFEEFQNILMRSLNFFWPLERLDMVVVMDAETKSRELERFLKRETLHANSLRIGYSERSRYYAGKGSNRQQLIMFWADNFTNADFVGFVDTDTLFVSPVSDEDLFVNGKPVIIGFYEHAGGHSGDQYKVATRRILRKPEVVRCMSYFPALIRTRHLRELREYVESIHNMSFNEYFSFMARNKTERYSQFVIMCNYVWYFHRDEYAWSIQEYVDETTDMSTLGLPKNEFTASMMQPKPRISVHYKHFFYKKWLEEQYFPSYAMALGFCYDILVRPVKKTYGICANDKMRLDPANPLMYGFAGHNWLHHHGVISSFQKRQKKLGECEPHKWNQIELLKLITDISNIKNVRHPVRVSFLTAENKFH